MTAYEMMLSESQERMLMVLKPGKEAAARAIFEKWGVDFAVIGETTDTGRLIVRHGGKVEADLPVAPLADAAPDYDRPFEPLERPEPLADPQATIREVEARFTFEGGDETAARVVADAFIDDRVRPLEGLDVVGLSVSARTARIYARFSPDATPDIVSIEEAAKNLKESGAVASFALETHDEEVDLSDQPGADAIVTALTKLMAGPDLCSRRWIFEQYDHTVMADTVIAPGGDAALVRVHGSNRAIAMTTDVTPRYVKADPREGAKQAVAETYRNICATGAAPLAVTNCLNFANPERPEVMAQFVGAVEAWPKRVKR